MKHRSSTLYILHFTFAFAFACSAAPARKYLAFAWEFQGHGPKDLLAVADQFAATPIDGVMAGESVADGDGWKEGRAIATVPMRATSLCVTLGLNQKPGERTEYRDLAIYRLWPCRDAAAGD